MIPIGRNQGGLWILVDVGGLYLNVDTENLHKFYGQPLILSKVNIILISPFLLPSIQLA